MKELKRTIKIKDDEIYQLRNQLVDKKFHENEFDFDILCEKYVDDCAMRAMQGLIYDGFHNSNPAVILAEESYYIAEAMLKEKLKRKTKND